MFRLFLKQLSLIQFTEPEPFHQEDKRSDQCDQASYHAFSGFWPTQIRLFCLEGDQWDPSVHLWFLFFCRIRVPHAMKTSQADVILSLPFPPYFPKRLTLSPCSFHSFP